VPRATIAHDFIWGYAGSERTLEAIAHLHPEAGVWAILGSRTVAERMGVAERFHTVLPDSELLLRHYRALTPLYPAIVRSRRLPAADVLITSSFAFANGFRTENDAPQLCYCHTPARFAWSMTEEYGRELPGGAATTKLLSAFAAPMRTLDRRRATAVTRYVATSDWVAEQIRRYYDRPATIIRPPVDTERFTPAGEGHDGYFLFCGRLVEPYKRPTAVVEAFRRLGLPLVMAGDGPARAELERSAPENVTFTGELADDELIPLMQRCAALVFPSRDDFGLLPVEVMACGRPVLAFAGGGALETVTGGTTGEFFDEQSADAIVAAVEAFDPGAYEPAAIREHALDYGLDRFREAMRAEVAATAARERL
jgi:glycosyltransferase involved in cell wall biosynthesis